MWVSGARGCRIMSLRLAQKPGPRVPRSQGAAAHDYLSHIGRFRGVRILVIEDEPAIQRFIARVLALEGAAVGTAATGKEALGRIEAEDPFHLILLDLCLPDISGWDVLDAVRLLDPSRSACPVVIVSADAGEESRRRATLLGAGFVAKPVTARALTEHLAPYIRRDPDALA